MLKTSYLTHKYTIETPARGPDHSQRTGGLVLVPTWERGDTYGSENSLTTTADLNVRGTEKLEHLQNCLRKFMVTL